MRYGFIVLLLLSASLVVAQENSLTAQDVNIETQTDAFGQEIQVAVGELVNSGDSAYTGITLYAELYDANDEVIGEGFGYPVNGCGVALLDFVLQPWQSQRFTVYLERYEEDTELARVEIIPEATSTDPEIDFTQDRSTGLARYSNEEVVALEWIDADNARYGVGCDGDVFTLLDWYEINLNSGDITPLDAHPNAEFITDAMRNQTGLTDPVIFRRSFITYQPGTTRMVYQTDLNHMISAERDGSFKRIISDDLFRHSLHGILWLQDRRFMAYYYGAYGDPVRYFVANTDGQRISEDIYNVTLSQIVPGPTPDGLRAVIVATLNEVSGYYLHSTVNDNVELLFEGDAPGNNYPAPVYLPQPETGAWIYIVRPVDGENWLQCFDTATRELHDLTVLPLNLTPDERGWAWLSPDNDQLVLTANGVHGGLWTVDLTAFDVCR